MPAPLSIVLPTLNAATTLGATLQSVSGGRPSALIGEIIISDGGSGDATVMIARRFAAEIVPGPAGRGGQLGRGAAAATGTWLLFLHADTKLGPGWEKSVRAHLARSADRAACFRLRFQDAGLWPAIFARWANFRTRMFGLPYGDQGLLIRRDLLDEIGGYPDLPLMEDVAIARALGRRRIRLLGTVAITCGDRFARHGWLRQGLRNMVTLYLYFRGVPPERLVVRYHRK